jgi:hypothetical protein
MPPQAAQIFLPVPLLCGQSLHKNRQIFPFREIRRERKEKRGRKLKKALQKPVCYDKIAKADMIKK